MGLRLDEGVVPAVLARRFQLPAAALLDDGKVELYRSLGLLTFRAGRLAVTDAGMPLLDAILGEIVGGELVAS